MDTADIKSGEQSLPQSLGAVHDRLLSLMDLDLNLGVTTLLLLDGSD